MSATASSCPSTSTWSIRAWPRAPARRNPADSRPGSCSTRCGGSPCRCRWPASTWWRSLRRTTTPRGPRSSATGGCSTRWRASPGGAGGWRGGRPADRTRPYPKAARQPAAARRLRAGRAAEVIGRLDAAENELAAYTGLRAGRLRLAAFPSALGTIVPAAAAMLRGPEPGVDLRLAEAEPPEALRMLRAGYVDVALVFRYSADPPGADDRHPKSPQAPSSSGPGEGSAGPPRRPVARSTRRGPSAESEGWTAHRPKPA